MNNKIPNLNILDEIKKVDAPPFLFTRIKQKIEESAVNRFSLKLSWSLVISFVLVLLLNGIVFVKNTPKSNEDISIVQTMDLLPNNSIYK